MVLLEAGKLPHRRFLSIWKLPELRGIEVTPGHVTLGAMTTYTEVRRHEILAREFPLLVPRRRRNRKHRNAEPRHARRQHRERLACRRFAARVCSSTTRNSNSSPQAARAGCRTTAFGPATNKWACAGRTDSRHSAAARHATVGGTTTARLARAARRPSRRCASPPRRASMLAESPMYASLSAASRQRSSAPCKQKTRCAARSRLAAILRAAARCARARNCSDRRYALDRSLSLPQSRKICSSNSANLIRASVAAMPNLPQRSGDSANTNDLIVRGKRVITPEGERAAAIHIRDGVIAAVARFDDVP